MTLSGRIIEPVRNCICPRTDARGCIVARYAPTVVDLDDECPCSCHHGCPSCGASDPEMNILCPDPFHDSVDGTLEVWP